MGFDQRLLNANEEILLDLRPHWWFVTPQALLLIAAMIVAAIAAGLSAPQLVLLGLAIVIVLAAINLAWRWVNWNGVNFVITTDRLIFRSGVVSKRGIEIPLERINTVFYSQSVPERMVGSGDLSVESAGEGGQQHFANVRRPKLVQQEIYRAMEINKNEEFTAMAQAHADTANAQHAAGVPMISIPQQIAELDQLRLRGVITEAEFQTKKTELLDRM